MGSYDTKVYKEQGGDKMVVASGGAIDVEAGGALKLAGTAISSSAAELNILDGVTKTAAQINALVAGAAGGYKIARGQATTVTASDDVDTGLATVVAAVASLEDDPVIGCDRAQAVIGDQAGAPAAGHVYIKTFCPTAAGDATPKAATTFGKKVSWIAIGT